MNNPYQPVPQRRDRGQQTHDDPTFREAILRMALQESRRAR